MTKNDFLKMFLAFLLMMVTLLANAQGKPVTLEAVKMDLPTALSKVERMSDYYKLNYSVKKLSQFKVTASIKNQQAPDAVASLISGLPLTITVNGKFIEVKLSGKQSPASTVAKSKGISGVVTDEDGEPLAGVNIVEKNGTARTVTDVDGRFIISTKADKMKLILTYVGMKEAEVTATNGIPVKVAMIENHTMLNEIVVTGYQEVKKEKMTGAVTTISADKLEERYTPYIIKNLEGRVAGLTTYRSKPVIRGTGTLHGTTAPLLVVDGLPVESSLEDLNPYDIESVNVLKDASASAIYGARAANGIIVVTTKNAKKKGKIDIDFSTNITLFEDTNYDYADNFYMTPEQQIKAESDYHEYFFFNNNGEIKDPIRTTQTKIDQGAQELTPLNMAYFRLAKGEITREQLNQTIDQLKKNNFARDFAKEMTHTRVMQQYNLSLRSSSDKYRNNLVLNYKHDGSNYINHKNDWLNVSYKGSYDLASWFTATIGINCLYTYNKGYGKDINSGMFNPWAYTSYMPFYNEDGTIRRQYPFYSGTSDGVVPKGLEELGIDPKQEALDNTAVTRNQNMRYNVDLLFRVISGLTLNTLFIYEVTSSEWQFHATEGSHAARTLKNAYAYLDGENVKYMTPEKGGILQTNNKNGNYWTARFQANYSKTFGKHDIMAIGGFEFRETLSKGTKSLVLGYDEQLQNSSTHTVDFGKLSQISYSPYFMSSAWFPCYQYAFTPYIRESLGINTEVKHRYASGYFNATYTFDERYNLFGSFRKDYADVYGLDTKFRGKPLWSVGAGWNIHKEKFMHDITWVNFLKLRFSYGVTGNIYQGASSLMTATSTGMNSTTNQPLGEIISPANPDLRWEQNRTTNIGVDYSFMNYRLRGSIDLYHKKGEDIFHSINLDPTYGFSSMVANAASISNKGVEATISYDWFQPRKRSSFGWTTSMTFTFNKNEVTKVENEATRAYQLTSTPYKVGYPVNTMWSYRFAGIGEKPGERGMLLFYGDNDTPSHSVMSSSPDILEYSGQSDPKRVIAMDNSLRWNGLSLGVTAVYYGGHKMRALVENEIFSDSWSTPLASYFLNAWTPENPTNTPGIGQYGTRALSSEAYYSNRAIHDASFIKIRNIVFGYDLPDKLLKHVGINNLRFTFQINDPKAIWVANKVGVDPETYGIRNSSSYVFGLNINL